MLLFALRSERRGSFLPSAMSVSFHSFCLLIPLLRANLLIPFSSSNPRGCSSAGFITTCVGFTISATTGLTTTMATSPAITSSPLFFIAEPLRDTIEPFRDLVGSGGRGLEASCGAIPVGDKIRDPERVLSHGLLFVVKTSSTSANMGVSLLALTVFGVNMSSLSAAGGGTTWPLLSLQISPGSISSALLESLRIRSPADPGFAKDDFSLAEDVLALASALAFWRSVGSGPTVLGVIPSWPLCSRSSRPAAGVLKLFDLADRLLAILSEGLLDMRAVYKDIGNFVMRTSSQGIARTTARGSLLI